ncbi:MAG: hypothetical protein RSE50_00700 [Myroides sp.]
MILDVKDLRIGNIVCDDTTFKTFNFIESIIFKNGEYAVSLRNKHYATWLEHNGEPMIFGIPLTEEWLIKLGFEDTKDYHYRDKTIKDYAVKEWFNSEFSYIFTIKKGNVEFGSMEYPNTEPKPPKYVHELQNLYFSFTGKELIL